MGTAPNGWQTPKTDWQAADAPGPSDFNRIEGNSNAIETGDRTVDQTQTPTGHVGTLRQLLDWFANRIKAILGTANWYDAPPITLQATKSHTEAGAAHGATSQAVAGKIMVRDAYGRVKVASPAVADDVARLDTVTVHTERKDNPHVVTAVQIGAANILTEILKVDGAGSGLDADLLDGKHASAFALIASGSYTGDGTTDRLITVGFGPKMVYAVGDNEVYGLGLGMAGTPFGAGMYTSSSDKRVAKQSGNQSIPYLVSNGFTVSAQTNSLNFEGITYYWVAVG
jgi:hypothetical protein